MQSRARRSIVSRSIAYAVTFVAALSCQAVFGDYRIDTSSVVGNDERCEPGDTRCVGAALQTCAPGGFGFETEVTCDSPALCNVDTEGCTRCTPGHFQCNGAVLRKCAEDSTWTDMQTCASAGLCVVDDDKLQGSCMTACEPGAFLCTGEKLQRCAREGERWDTVELCAHAELCSVELAQQQAALGAPVHCVPPVCRAGDFSCDDGSVRPCAPGLSGWAPATQACDPKDQCNPKLGACKTCVPGEHTCSGATPLTCNSAGKWEAKPDCASPALCKATTGTCTEPGCETPGAYSCDPMRVLLRRCKTDRTTWEVLASCRSFDLCNVAEGRCEAAACPSGAIRCQGDRLERCSANLTGWDLVQTCKRGELCDPVTRCTPGECAENTTRCNDRFLERCVDGTWERLDRCVTRELCPKDGKACTPPACAPGEYICTGNDQEALERCNPGRTEYVHAETCLPPQRCDAVTGTCH